MNKLPDKGQKIQELYDRVLKALEEKSKIDSTSKLLEKMNLSSKNVDKIEWKDDDSPQNYKDPIDSDDDEDPMAILATSNTTTGNQKIVKNELEDKPLVTDEDVEEANNIFFDPIVEQVCENEKLEPSFRFHPNKPKSNSNKVDSPLKERENTSATPPVCKKTTQQISLRESFELEHIHQQKLKELKEKQAAERLFLKQKEGFSIVQPTDLDSSIMKKYRDVSNLIDDDEDDDNDSGEDTFLDCHEDD